MRLLVLAVAAILLASVAHAQGRTVVKMEPNGVKVITMQTARGTAVIRCDRNNVPITSQNADGLDLRDICRRN